MAKKKTNVWGFLRFIDFFNLFIELNESWIIAQKRWSPNVHRQSIHFNEYKYTITLLFLCMHVQTKQNLYIQIQKIIKQLYECITKWKGMTKLSISFAYKGWAVLINN
jgi:hypothetical protein